MKKILTATTLLVPFISFAAEGETVPLMTDLPIIGDSTNLAGLLQGMFRLTLGIAVTAAVVIIVINGIRYMVSDVAGKKEDAKSWIQEVIWGLILAFASVLILSTINPNLTRFDFINTLQEVGGGITPSGGGTVPPQPPGGGGGGTTDPAQEAAVRAELALHNITVNQDACEPGEGVPDCINVGDLPGNAISRLVALAEEDCGCSLRITGGTENGHETHGPGLPMVDLQRNSAITTLIQEEGVLERITCLGPLYNYGGSQFLDENKGGPHWHACLGTQCSFAPGC